MTEQDPADEPAADQTVPEQPEEGPEEGPEEQDTAPAAAAESTGSTGSTRHEGVDRVLGSLAGLEEQPVDDHVAVFERAHDDLRRALSDAGDRD